MADLAMWLFQQTALDLLMRPFGDEDQELLEEGLPPPMYPGERKTETLTIASRCSLLKLFQTQMRCRKCGSIHSHVHAFGGTSAICGEI